MEVMVNTKWCPARSEGPNTKHKFVDIVNHFRHDSWMTHEGGHGQVRLRILKLQGMNCLHVLKSHWSRRW
jgi:hypothetical protein